MTIQSFKKQRLKKKLRKHQPIPDSVFNKSFQLCCNLRKQKHSKDPPLRHLDDISQICSFYPDKENQSVRVKMKQTAAYFTADLIPYETPSRLSQIFPSIEEARTEMKKLLNLYNQFLDHDIDPEFLLLEQFGLRYSGNITLCCQLLENFNNSVYWEMILEDWNDLLP